MRAAIARHGSIVIGGVPDPPPRLGEVVAMTRACGICGSDLHAPTHTEQVADAARVRSSEPTRGRTSRTPRSGRSGMPGPAIEDQATFEYVGVPGIIQRVMEGAEPGAKIIVDGVCSQPDTLEPMCEIDKELDFRFTFGHSPEEASAALHQIAEVTIDARDQPSTDQAESPRPDVRSSAPSEDKRIMSSQKNVSQRIIELLEAEGVRTLFGIPDPGFARMHREAADRGWDVIAPHHEEAGAFMADALSRMTGGPAVIVGNQGPGVANLVPAAICASKERIPVLFLAGQRGRALDAQVRRSKFQYTDQPRFFEGAMKYVGVIEFAHQVDEVLHEAFRRAMTGAPGPVYVEFPQDHANAEVDLPPAPPPESYRLVRQKADPDAVERAAQLLREATCPILLPGTGVHTSRGHAELERLARVLQCPVLPSWGGLGCLPMSHPQVLPYSVGPANDAVAEADVVLAVGTAIGEQLHYGTGLHWSKGNTDRKWIYIERDPAAVGVNRAIDVPLVGDLRSVLPQLTEAVGKNGAPTPNAKLAGWRSTYEAMSNELVESAPETVPIHPGRMMAEAARCIPEDAVIVRDGGSTALWALFYGPSAQRDQLWTSKFGHLGAGLPYAIGAQLAVGHTRRVCLITGDSAFQFHISELETAVRKNLPIVVIVNSDAAWGMELPVFFGAFGPNKDVEVNWGHVRFDKIAEGFGAHGEYVEQTAEIAPAVERAFTSGRVAVVQVAVDPNVNALQAPHAQEFVTWYTGGGYSA